MVVFTAAACLFTGAGVGWFLLGLGALSVAWVAIAACLAAGEATRMEEEHWAAIRAGQDERSRDAA